MAYNPRKAAQIIAAFILKNQSKHLRLTKVVKLVYLADRESIARSNFPMLDEPRYSMKFGPVNSLTLNYIKSELPEGLKGFDTFSKFVNKDHLGLYLADSQITEDSLDELSALELKCIDKVWEEHGNKSASDLVNWTHEKENIPEWKNPEETHIPIEFIDILKSLNIANAEEIESEYQEFLKDDDIMDGVRESVSH